MNRPNAFQVAKSLIVAHDGNTACAANNSASEITDAIRYDGDHDGPNARYWAAVFEAICRQSTKAHAAAYMAAI